MKKITPVLVCTIIALAVMVLLHIFHLKDLANSESYPQDTYLSKEKNKTAVIIVAHDDDAISMSGTISKLAKDGWDIHELCFYQGFKGKDSIRKRDLKKAASILGIESVEYYDTQLRKSIETVDKPWLPIPYSEIEAKYNKEVVTKLIDTFINKFQPSVVFTLDDVLGGYGHPDHVFISRLISEYLSRDNGNSVKRIYQALLSPKMTEKIMKDMKAFQLAKEVYQFDKTPEPNTVVSIAGTEGLKKKAMLAYTTEQNSTTKIWPYYRYYPASIYFGIFDKEYYRVLKN